MEDGVIYQIYPRSFQDSNGDGVGDLPGISERLDYLHGSASTPSGSRRSIPRQWRTSDTTSPTTATSTLCSARLPISIALVAEAHAREIKIILDFVPNHTSDQHPWFRECARRETTPSATGTSGAIGKPDGVAAEQLASQFGGPAWTLDARPGSTTCTVSSRAAGSQLAKSGRARGDVRRLRFWLDRGVDGFRIDVIWLLIKDDKFRDNPPNPAYRPTEAGINRFLMSTPPTSPRSTGSSPRCARVLDVTTSAC